MEESKLHGTDSKQNRESQPKRAGGNSDAYGSEKHGQAKSSQIAIGGSTGDKKPGQGFIEGGNAAAGPSVEKHDLKKDTGATSDIPENIEVCGYANYGGGNSSDGKHEPSNSKKARVLDMSVKRFER